MRIGRHIPRAKAFALVFFNTHYILSYLDTIYIIKELRPACLRKWAVFYCFRLKFCGKTKKNALF